MARGRPDPGRRTGVEGVFGGVFVFGVIWVWRFGFGVALAFRVGVAVAARVGLWLRSVGESLW